MNVVGIQHVLPSLSVLLESLEAGAWRQVELAGKPYSTVPAAVEAHHRRFPNCRISASWNEIDFGRLPAETIALDEGGIIRDHARAGSILAGVEQTSSGGWKDWRWPTVLVCRSAAKLLLESQIISRGILRKLDADGHLGARQIGILGLGALGSELMRSLALRGHKVLGYDRKPVRGLAGVQLEDATELVARCDLILGATGRDSLAGVALHGSGEKVFASCSSSNIEFASLLARAPAVLGFAVATVPIAGETWTVLNGGFPINFDRDTEWERPDEIWLTRTLCARGLDQARGLVGLPAHGVMLSPAVQQEVVMQWLDRIDRRDEIRLPPDMSQRFFVLNSEGAHAMSQENDYQLHETTPDALTRMRAHDEPYDVTILGTPIRVLPGVWSPAYDWSSLFYVENLPDIAGQSFLEIGCGTGVIASFAARAGASKVVAADVNPLAVENARQNFERLRLTKASAVQSDLFDGITGQFDVVTWNAPYHGAAPADMLERGCTDENYRDIRRFFAEVTTYLAPGGTVVFGFSESGDLLLLRELIRDAGFKVRRELSDWRQDYNCMLFDLEIDVTKQR